MSSPPRETAASKALAEAEKRRYRKGSREERFHVSLSSHCSQTLSGEKSIAFNCVLLYHQPALLQHPSYPGFTYNSTVWELLLNGPLV